MEVSLEVFQGLNSFEGGGLNNNIFALLEVLLNQIMRDIEALRRQGQTRYREDRKPACILRVNGSCVNRSFHRIKPLRTGRRDGWVAVWAVNLSCFGTCLGVVRQHRVAA